MFAWLKKLFRRSPPPDEAPPPWAQELLEEFDPDRKPPWAEELGEAVQRAARAQGKTGLRLEQIEQKLDDGLGEIKQQLGVLVPATRWDDLLDAMDLLEEARRGLEFDEPEVAAGLGGVLTRLEKHLGQSGLTRHSDRHQSPDGRRFRVVGTEEDHNLPDGVVTRVVRAAVTRGDKLVREGAVLTNRRLLS